MCSLSAVRALRSIDPATVGRIIAHRLVATRILHHPNITTRVVLPAARMTMRSFSTNPQATNPLVVDVSYHRRSPEEQRQTTPLIAVGSSTTTTATGVSYWKTTRNEMAAPQQDHSLVEEQVKLGDFDVHNIMTERQMTAVDDSLVPLLRSFLPPRPCSFHSSSTN